MSPPFLLALSTSWDTKKSYHSFSRRFLWATENTCTTIWSFIWKLIFSHQYIGHGTWTDEIERLLAQMFDRVWTNGMFPLYLSSGPTFCHDMWWYNLFQFCFCIPEDTHIPNVHYIWVVINLYFRLPCINLWGCTSWLLKRKITLQCTRQTLVPASAGNYPRFLFLSLCKDDNSQSIQWVPRSPILSFDLHRIAWLTFPSSVFVPCNGGCIACSQWRCNKVLEDGLVLDSSV